MRNLTQCPYCSKCELALEEYELIFNPDTETKEPCAHLVWVSLRFSEWGKSSHGIDHVIGSSEVGWEHPDLQALETEADIEREDYFAQLTQQGSEWDFAPSVPFQLLQTWDEKKTVDDKGKEHVLWDIDGWAIFAEDAKAFVEALPKCHLDWAESLQL